MVIFDSSILVDDLRTGRHSRRIAALDELICNSAVVLAELWRGATTDPDRFFLRTIEKSYPIFTPTEKIWLESGRILSKMQQERGFQGPKLRELHFDVLIALTARAHGARLITSNRADFELIRGYREFKLEGW
jgi:predicted nucleic acid-binding protein